MDLGKDFSFPKVHLLDFLVQVKMLVGLPMEMCVFMRLAFYVAFISPFIHLSCNFCIISRSPLVNSSLMLGGRL